METGTRIEEERKATAEVKEQLGLTERKCNATSGELEESRALLDAAVRGQRQVEQELIDTREQTVTLQTANQLLANGKRKLGSDIHQVQADLDALIANAKNSEEKAKKAMVDAGRLADELRSEQAHSMTQERAVKTTEKHLTELACKAEEASEHAAVTARQMPAKLEAKIKEVSTLHQLESFIQKPAFVRILHRLNSSSTEHASWLPTIRNRFPRVKGG